MYAENSIFFSYCAIAALRNTRGEKWQALVERVLKLPPTHEETLALMFTMVRLNGCLGCETDSFRAMKGCATCALQTLRRYKGDDEELLAAYDKSLAEVRRFADSDGRYTAIMGEPVQIMSRPPQLALG